MDTNKMREQAREQFEVWHKNQKAALVALGYVGAARQHEEFKGLMAEVWQASREAVVVVLPPPHAWDNDGEFDPYYDPDAETGMALIPRIDVRMAIETQGLKCGVKL